MFSPVIKFGLTANTIIVCAEHSWRLHFRPELASAHSVRWLYPLQPVADMRYPELDRLRFLRAILPAQLPTWFLQGVRLHGTRPKDTTQPISETQC
jgi:hypothetical protein